MDDYMLHKVKTSNKGFVDQYKNYMHSEKNKRKPGEYVPRYRYLLKGVISHIGESMVGHYVAFIKYTYHNSESYWILYSGDNMTNVTEDRVL
jgi:uncharacterized UBP type Zn finger protein